MKIRMTKAGIETFIQEYKKEKGSLHGAKTLVKAAFLDRVYEISANVDTEVADSGEIGTAFKALQEVYKAYEFFEKRYEEEKQKKEKKFVGLSSPVARLRVAR